MSHTITKYLKAIEAQHQDENASESSYRGALEDFLHNINLDETLRITNEPKGVEAGKPDILVKNANGFEVGYIETKNIGENLDDKKYDEQFNRYKNKINNLIITDYLEFRFFFRNSDTKNENEKTFSIGTFNKVTDKIIVADKKNYDDFFNRLQEFLSADAETITSAEVLAYKLASRTKSLKQTIQESLDSDKDKKEKSTLQNQFDIFKEKLIHDLTVFNFADMYAQTIAYGLFTARLHDRHSKDFKRKMAAEDIPKSNPFLRKFFNFVAGFEIDKRIMPNVDNLALVLKHTQIADIIEENKKNRTQSKDEKSEQQTLAIHFYETFLDAYNPQEKKAKGIYYTPDAVVDFIVKAIDHLLRTKFDIANGIGNNDTVTVGIPKKIDKKEIIVNEDIHKVQILDPATGTGTFLVKTIEYIYQTYYHHKQAMWSEVVNNHLINRLHGFELVMASYAMTHLSVEMALQEIEGNPTKIKDDNRLSVYLTNSLEDYKPKAEQLNMFADWIDKESQEAADIKRNKPVMVVMGNPPYRAASTNKSKFILNLIDDYKYVDGEHFGERKHWLNDDYVKFIRLGEHFVAKNKEGVLGFINNHAFLDNLTFRGMRWHLLNTFDAIYIIDLHGNARMKEVAPAGDKDENVFKIMAGVSINLFVKTGKKKAGSLASVYHTDLWGSRQQKLNTLLTKNLDTIGFDTLQPKAPYYFLVPKDDTGKEEYKSGFKITKLFTNYVSGIVTARDKFTIHFNKEKLKQTIEDFLSMDDEQAREKFQLGKDGRDWKVPLARKDVINFKQDAHQKIKPISYRPFDTRFTYYTKKEKGFLQCCRGKVMQHFIEGDNIGLVFKIGHDEKKSAPIGVSNKIIDFRSWSRPGMQGGDYIAPLYLYPTDTDKKFEETLGDEPTERTPNLDMEIVEQIANGLGISFTPEKVAEPAGGDGGGEKTFTPEHLLDYIYAVLHAPSYRSTYREFLKTDFPCVPYPTNVATFWQLVAHGKKLRALHLLPITESLQTEMNAQTQSGMAGFNDIVKDEADNGRIEKISFEPSTKASEGDEEMGCVRISSKQTFSNVPRTAWEFYIGGYQPAQKWLSSRKNTRLHSEEITHYQEIIFALWKTTALMSEIDVIFSANLKR